MLPVRFHNTTAPNFSNLFDEFFGKDMEYNASCSTTMPSVNIIESNEAFTIQVAAPGLEKKDFNVAVDGNKLTISSEKELEGLKDGEKFRKKQFSFSKFKRTFSIPEVLEGDKINAEYNSGILNVTIPKKEPVKKEIKQIKVG
ncbi:MAG: Hsp20/alpha crystallin family protein [Flavobacteriales bacterium]|nr:Hsp20/alpha crystallin family protein [Flavobacteriales bacterium]